MQLQHRQTPCIVNSAAGLAGPSVRALRLRSSWCRGAACLHVPSAFVEEHGSTYLQEQYVRRRPKERPCGIDYAALQQAPPINIESMNHAALGEIPGERMQEVVRFYKEVLGFTELPRPGFPFDGTWLTAGGLFLHLIESDPSVPSQFKMVDQRAGNPEPNFVRRSNHLAFAVKDLAAVEQRLEAGGIWYDKFVIPGSSSVQLFIHDPLGNGVEMGEGYKDVDDMLAEL